VSLALLPAGSPVSISEPTSTRNIMMAFLRLLACLAGLLTLGAAAPAQSSSNAKRATALPAYALTYAPYTYIYSGEQWFPSDIKTHLANTIPEVNFTPIGAQGSATVNNLNSYNSSVYLSEATPGSNSLSWEYSVYGKPSGGVSAAPGTIIAVQKNATWVDVFYFYFYSYNQGEK
jgi:hypothetical protein